MRRFTFDCLYPSVRRAWLKIKAVLETSFMALDSFRQAAHSMQGGNILGAERSRGDDKCALQRVARSILLTLWFHCPDIFGFVFCSLVRTGVAPTTFTLSCIFFCFFLGPNV